MAYLRYGSPTGWGMLALSLGSLASSCASGPKAGPSAPAGASRPAVAEASQPAAARASGSSRAFSPVSGEVILAAQTSPEPASGGASLSPLCGQMCDRLEASCNEDQVSACQLNCTRFEGIDARCHDAGREALDCALQADDLLCIQVAPPSCLEPFKAYHRCVADPQGYQPVPRQSAAGVAGGPELTDRQHGFRVRLPVEGNWEAAGAPGSWRAETPRVRWLTAAVVVPEGLTLPQRLMRAAEQIAEECKGVLRLHGQYESPGAVHVAFSGNCAARPWQGAVHLFGQQAFVTAIQGQVAEPESVRFFESFERL